MKMDEYGPIRLWSQKGVEEYKGGGVGYSDEAGPNCVSASIKCLYSIGQVFATGESLWLPYFWCNPFSAKHLHYNRAVKS